jgi:hypothetical protein
MPGITCPYPHSLFLVIVLFHHVDCLFHLSEDQVAVAVVGLDTHIMVSIIPRRADGGAYVEAALEFTVTAQLHKNDLIKGKANKIQGLRNGCASIFGVGHDELEGY